MEKINTTSELVKAFSESLIVGELLDVSKIKRGIGKSRFLFEIVSKTTDCFIIVPNTTLAIIFNSRFDTYKYCSVKMLDRLRGKVENVFLEEGLTLEEEEYCKKTLNVIGGYTSNTNKKGIGAIRESFIESRKRLKELLELQKHSKCYTELIEKTINIERDYQRTLIKMLVSKIEQD